MNQLIPVLTSGPLDALPIEKLKTIVEVTDRHISIQTAYLSTVAKMAAICSQDASNGTIGGFDFSDMANLGYFLESELMNLSVINDYKQDAAHHLEIKR